jgi:thiamine transport system ATP-binding protein
MIKLDALTTRYQNQQLVFSLQLAAADKLAIVGASGAGKSTLLALIAGFLPVAQGKLWLNGVDHTHSAPAKRPVSILFQQNNLFTHLTVQENLALGLDPRLKLSAEQSQTLLTIAERAGLHSLLQRLPNTLSGGQQQRVALARCLLRRRPILLLDEPFSGLDPKLRSEMLTLAGEVCQQQQMTLLMVTHQIDEVQALADKVLQIENGQVSWQGSKAQFFASAAR